MANTIHERFNDSFLDNDLIDYVEKLSLWNIRLKNDFKKECVKRLVELSMVEKYDDFKNEFDDEIKIFTQEIEIKNRTNEEILVDIFKYWNLDFDFSQIDNDWLENKTKHVQI